MKTPIWKMLGYPSEKACDRDLDEQRRLDEEAYKAALAASLAPEICEDLAAPDYGLGLFCDLSRRLNRAPDLTEGPQMVPLAFSRMPGTEVEVDLKDVVDSPEQYALLMGMKELYGNRFKVTLHRSASREGEGEYRKLLVYLYGTSHITGYWRESLIERIAKCKLSTADRDTARLIMIAKEESYFAIHGLNSYYPLETALLYQRDPAVDELFLRTMVNPTVSDDGNRREVQVFQALRGGSFGSCPTLGESVDLGSSSALLPKNGGVVAEFKGKRYRITFDWEGMSKDGWATGPAQGQRLLTLERTDDPLSEPVPTDDYYDDLGLFGYGSSQQADTAVPFCGTLPHCLMVFHTGGDFTWCIMVTLDHNDEVEVAWLEGSCT